MVIWRQNEVYQICKISRKKRYGKLRNYWYYKLGNQGKWSVARKTKLVDETLRVFSKCSTRRNGWEKSFKSAKWSCSSCCFAHHSGQCRKRKKVFSSRKIYSTNLQNNYFRKIFGKMQLQEFHIFQYLQSLCHCFRKRRNIK